MINFLRKHAHAKLASRKSARHRNKKEVTKTKNIAGHVMLINFVAVSAITANTSCDWSDIMNINICHLLHSYAYAQFLLNRPSYLEFVYDVLDQSP